jgi:hypothetical protein
LFRKVKIVARGACMAVFGLLMLWGAVTMGRKAVLLWQDTRQADATVVHTWTSGAFSKKYELIYKLYGGSEFVKVDEATWLEARRTKTIPVVYSGVDPTVSALDLWSDALYAVGVLIFGLLCLRYTAVHVRRELRDAWQGPRGTSGVPA